VFDITGKEVATLLNQEKPAGKYQLTFDASGFASGIYLYQIKANSRIIVKKMLLLK